MTRSMPVILINDTVGTPFGMMEVRFLNYDGHSSITLDGSGNSGWPALGIPNTSTYITVNRVKMRVIITLVDEGDGFKINNLYASRWDSRPTDRWRKQKYLELKLGTNVSASAVKKICETLPTTASEWTRSKTWRTLDEIFDAGDKPTVQEVVNAGGGAAYAELDAEPDGTECQCDGCMDCGAGHGYQIDYGCGMPATRVLDGSRCLCDDCIN